MSSSIILHSPSLTIQRSSIKKPENILNNELQITYKLIESLDNPENINEDILIYEECHIYEKKDIKIFFKKTENGILFLFSYVNDSENEFFNIYDKIKFLEEIEIFCNSVFINENFEDLMIGFDQFLFCPFKNSNEIIEMLLMESYNESVYKENQAIKNKEVQERYEEMRRDEEYRKASEKFTEKVEMSAPQLEIINEKSKKNSETFKKRECPLLEGLTVKEVIKLQSENSSIKEINTTGEIFLYREKDYVFDSKNLSISKNNSIDFSPYVLKEKLPEICLRENIPINKKIPIGRYKNFVNEDSFPLKISVWKDEKYLIELISSDEKIFDVEMKFNGKCLIDKEEDAEVFVRKNKTFYKFGLKGKENKMLEIEGDREEVFPLRVIFYSNQTFEYSDNEKVRKWLEIDWRIENDE